MARQLQFQEIALRIQPGTAGLCTVHVAQSSYGTRASCQADFSSLTREESLIRGMETVLRGSGPGGRALRNLSGDAADTPVSSPQSVGDRLFRALFSGAVL